MRSRAPTTSVSEGSGLRLANDPQVRKWAKRIKGDPEARPHQLSESQLRLVALELAKRRGELVSETHFDRAFEATRPLLAVPDVTDAIADLDLMLRLPEMEAFWAKWQRPPAAQGSRGPRAADEAVKALMTVMAIPGMTTHATHAHWLLGNTPALREIFGGVAQRGAARLGRPGSKQAFDPLTYQGALRHRREVAAGCTQLAMATNIELLKSLRSRLGKRVGRVWLLDGCAVPAWAPQISANGDGEVEARLRRFAPDAGFRAFGYTGNGKVDVDALDGDAVRSAVKGGKGKSWRGYYLMVLVEQATGLPGVWTLIDAQEQETTALVPLLSQLHHLWPEVDAEIVAGDSAFDNDPCCRVLEADYGIHPVFRLHDQRGPKDIPRGTVRGDRLLRVAGRGELICAAHGRRVDYETLDRPSREGLRPGQTSDERAFRYRVACSHQKDRAGQAAGACKRLSLPAQFDWSKLTYYPHHDRGRPDLYAMRQVLLSARLGQVESVFNALKGGYKLGGTGAGRTRIRELHVHEALISLAFLGRTALTVLDQRQRRGLRASPPVGARLTQEMTGPTPGSSNGDGAVVQSADEKSHLPPLSTALAGAVSPVRPSQRASRRSTPGSRVSTSTAPRGRSLQSVVRLFHEPAAFGPSGAKGGQPRMRKFS